MFGLVWMSQRTHEVARAGAWILVRGPAGGGVRRPVRLRESGSYEPDHRWLTVGDHQQLDQAGHIVVDQAGFDSFGLLSLDQPGYQAPAVPESTVSHERQVWLGVPFVYTVYQRGAS